MEAQHTKKFSRNGSRINLETENKTRVF